jgi:TolB-like protein/Tfp pilus assembly protein PilF
MEAVARFGAFEFDPRSGELRKRGIRIRLRDKVAQVLALLLAHPGELVSREELRERLWQPDVHVDFDNNLNTAIARLREALDDSAENARFIETLPRRGYRFVAPVTVSESAPSRLMVLPFSNLSGDPDQEYFCHGVTEEIITHLALLAPEKLRVIARTTSMQYAGSRFGVAEIGRALDLDFVVEGSVRLAASHVRITAQLIRTSDETHVWAGTFDGDTRDVLAIHTQAAAAIAKVTGLAASVHPAPTPVEPAVQDAYIRGLHHQCRGEYREAEQCFARATRLNPNFAPSWAKLAITCAVGGYFAHLSPLEAFSTAATAAARSVELDKSLADGWLAMALVHWFGNWEFPSCRGELERVVALNPSHAGGHWALACYYGALEEDHDRAYAEAVRMEELDPLNFYFRPYTGWVLYWGRQYERAVAHARETLRLSPECLEALWVLGWSATAMRRFDLALPALESAVERDGGPFSLAGLGAARAHMADRAGANAVLSELNDMVSSIHVSPMNFAWVYLAMGDCERGTRWLEKARREHDSQVLCVRVSPSNDGVRHDPRFQSFVETLRLPSPVAKLS